MTRTPASATIFFDIPPPVTNSAPSRTVLNTTLSGHLEEYNRRNQEALAKEPGEKTTAKRQPTQPAAEPAGRAPVAQAALDLRPRATAQRALLNSIAASPAMTAQRQALQDAFGDAAQFKGAQDEELQMKVAQRQGSEEEEPLQGRFPVAQREGSGEEELQMRRPQ